MISIITEEKEQIVNEWLQDHKTFIWSEILADMSDIAAERQLRYMINKHKESGYITFDKDTQEYRVVGNLEQIRKEMEEKHEEGNTPASPPGKDVPIEAGMEKKTEPVKVEVAAKTEEVKVPSIIAQKAKAIEKAQTEKKKVEMRREPRVVVKEKESPEEKKSWLKDNKLTLLIVGLAIAVVAFVLYQLLGKTPPPPPTPPVQAPQKSELERLGFVSAESLFGGHA